MDRRNILADNPVEKKRGYMPGVCVNPSRLLFTAGLTGRNPDGSIVAGGMAAQTQRAMERLQGVLRQAGADFSQTIKQVSISPTWTPTLLVDGPCALLSSLGTGRPRRRWACDASLIQPCSSRSSWSSIWRMTRRASRCSKSTMPKRTALTFIKASLCMAAA